MTAPPDLGPWLRQQREHRSWTRNELARRLIRTAQVSGDTAMPAATDVAANIYRWERGTVSLPEGADTQIKLASTGLSIDPDTDI